MASKLDLMHFCGPAIGHTIETGFILQISDC